MPLILITLIITFGSLNLFAQDAGSLKQSLIGKQARLKIEMPATDNGVDIFAQNAAIDDKSYRNRLKQYGRAYRVDEATTITCVKVERKRIEICLGGGGYKTVDLIADTAVINLPVSKSNREKSLEDELKRTFDNRRRDELIRDLERLKDQRKREDRIRSQNADFLRNDKRVFAQQKALGSGSRFIIRFDREVTAQDLNEENLVSILENYLEFVR
jgi:hypothetical protein